MSSNSHAMLVVDDEQSLREVLSELLREDGYEVMVAASAEEALVILERHNIGIVLTDIRMAGMSGIDLLHQIKAISPETQVIIMTSYASIETALAAMRAGAYDYLIKPFEDLQLVTSVVQRAYDKIRLVSENNLLIKQLQESNDELKKINSILKEMAIRDSLTGLYNHRYFQEVLASEVARCTRHKCQFSLVFFDIDHFKHYNDTHGHPEGDVLLSSLANIVAARLRKSDIAARYGGEEFVLLLPETNKEGAYVAAEELREKIENYPFAGREKLPFKAITISAGVATYPEDGLEASIILERVDQALYTAKDKGRNRVCLAGSS